MVPSVRWVSYFSSVLRRRSCLILFIIASSLLFTSQAWALSVTEIDSENPVKVELSVFVIDIDGIDTVEQNFEANLFFEARWHDQTLAHDDSSPIIKPLAEIWRPNIQVINQQKVWESFPEMVEISPEGQVTYRQRIWGDFSQKLLLRDFPFDRQTFNIQFVVEGYAHGQVELISDNGRKTGMAADLSESDWQILNWHAEPKGYEPIPGHGSQPGFVFTFDAQRKQSYFLFKVITPLILIVMMSWVAFWIDPADSGTDISVAVTSMLTLIAYRFAIGTFLPVISYLTRLDLFILGSTLLVFFSLVEVVVTSNLVRKRHREWAYTLDRVSRWVFPMVFFYLLFQTLYLPLPEWG